MSHLEKLKKVFDDIGVEYEVKPLPTRPLRSPLGVSQELVIDGNGYAEFYHAFEFDDAGALLNHGSWE